MKFTAGQLAEVIKGAVEGDANTEVWTFAKIEEGTKGALSFLSNPKYEPYIYTTQSSIVLVREDFIPQERVAATLIRVADPYAAVAQLLTIASTMMSQPKVGIEQPSHIGASVEQPDGLYVGAFAYVGDNVKLGKNVKIYPQAYVGDGCEVGDDTIIYAGVKIYANCKIGKRCIIHSGAVIGADGFGFAPVDGHYEKIPQIGIVEINDDVEIGANTTVDRATMGATVIAKGVKLDNLVQIAHNCKIGESTVMASQCGVAGSATVGAHCMFGGQVGIAGHISIGDKVEIAAQSGIHKSVSEGQRLFGSPAVDFREYVKTSSYIKDLPKMARKIKDLEKRDLQK